jgi:deazaflavin-dependent oxidoreductase (nitroreductase family)
MPIPTFVTKVNRAFTNRITGLFAGRIPPFAIIEHRGRTSGTLYRTPIMVFPFDGGFDIALTYGPEVDWARNVQAAGQCALEYRRRRIELVRPEHFSPMPESASIPAVVRWGLRIMGVHHYLRLHRLPVDTPR